MMTTITDDESLKTQLTQIRTQLNKKQTFEPAIISLKSLLLNSYESSTQSTKSLFNDVVNRVATVLRTRYTSPGFLTIGADVLETASRLSDDPAHVSKLNSALKDIKQSLQPDDEAAGPQQRGNGGGGYLFEGHLTVDSEPAQPNWLVQQGLLTALAASQQTTTTGEGDGDNAGDNDGMGSLLRGLVESLDVSMMEGLEDLLPGDIAGRRAAPPASKKVVEKLPVVKVDDGVLAKVGEDAECCICKEKLPVVKVDDGVLAKVGEDAECCICKEKLGVGDEMQEMPCKHLFHPLCLKPWLDEHNSCPICRHELPTDDHKYESWKEREKELEEERRGAANAVRGGEFMYI